MCSINSKLKFRECRKDIYIAMRWSLSMRSSGANGLEIREMKDCMQTKFTFEIVFYHNF